MADTLRYKVGGHFVRSVSGVRREFSTSDSESSTYLGGHFVRAVCSLGRRTKPPLFRGGLVPPRVEERKKRCDSVTGHATKRRRCSTIKHAPDTMWTLR